LELAFHFRGEWSGSARGGGEAALEINSIAVLAFENVGGDRENEVFATGVPEEILRAAAGARRRSAARRG
jgi:TolB-like protein